ncbi:MAG: ABC transporter ATP-binding protein, partial [Planctomycetota bacterium]
MTDVAKPLLRLEKVCKAFPDGQVKALVDVDLSIRSGEFLAVMGQSGSGKSTLLTMLGALDAPTSGRVLFEEEPLESWGNLDRFRSQELGFVFQSFHLLPTLTALENIQLPMFESDVSAAERVQRAERLLELVVMERRADHLPAKLSVGERQRVAIARSLANEPRILLADEPTGNLDSQTADGILHLFEELHRDQRMTVVVVTHSEEVALRADRLVRLRDGRVEEDRQLAVDAR